jgi:hypothetical protein
MILSRNAFFSTTGFRRKSACFSALQFMQKRTSPLAQVMGGFKQLLIGCHLAGSGE